MHKPYILNKPIRISIYFGVSVFNFPGKIFSHSRKVYDSYPDLKNRSLYIGFVKYSKVEQNLLLSYSV